MMHCSELSLGFKGLRTYIQGADMLDAVMRSVSTRAPQTRFEELDFKISTMTNRLLTCCWWPSSNPHAPEGKVVATFAFRLNGIAHEGKLIQTATYADARRAYDELPVQEQCIYNPARKSVSLRAMPENLTPIEVLVSMNKALLLKEMTIPSSSQWVFCRWESQTWPLNENLSGVELTLEQTLGTRLTRSNVKLATKQIGTIYFSALNVGNPPT